MAISLVCWEQYASRPDICMLAFPLLSKLCPSRWRCAIPCSCEQADPLNFLSFHLLTSHFLFMWVLHFWILELPACYLFSTLTLVLCVLFFFLILPDVIQSGLPTYKLVEIARAQQQFIFFSVRQEQRNKIWYHIMYAWT